MRIEIRQVEKERARKELESAAGIRRVVVQHPAADGVGDARRDALHPGVAAASAVAGDQAAA